MCSTRFNTLSRLNARLIEIESLLKACQYKRVQRYSILAKWYYQILGHKISVSTILRGDWITVL